MRNKWEAHMLLQRRFSLPGSKPGRTTKSERLLCPGGSERFQDRNLQTKNKTSRSSTSGIENLSDLKQGFKIRDIVVTTGQFTGITPDQILSERREPSWVEARHIVLFLICTAHRLFISKDRTHFVQGSHNNYLW